jgi:hypothetical protein
MDVGMILNLFPERKIGTVEFQYLSCNWDNRRLKRKIPIGNPRSRYDRREHVCARRRANPYIREQWYA